MRPIHLTFLIFIGLGCCFLPWPYVQLRSSCHRSNWSTPSFFSTTFQNSQGTLHLFPECPTFSSIYSYVPNV